MPELFPGVKGRRVTGETIALECQLTARDLILRERASGRTLRSAIGLRPDCWRSGDTETEDEARDHADKLRRRAGPCYVRARRSAFLFRYPAVTSLTG
jgi:hypothetical protein